VGNFIGFIIILFFVAALLRVDFFFSLLYLFLAIFILSHLWSRRVMQKLRPSRQMPPRAFWGDKVEVVLKLENQSRLPIPWLMFHEVFPLTLSSPSFFREVVSLPGKESYENRYTLTARKRGYYHIGPLTLSTGDMLGLRPDMTGQLGADSLIVYPRIVPILRLTLPTFSPHLALPTSVPLFQDPARPIGVRAYTPGDNPRHIHWTATAATNQVLVKQFQPAIARDNAIFLNLSRSDYVERGSPDTAIELAITVAASLANHMVIVEKLPVGLVVRALDPLIEKVQTFHIPPRKGRGHLMEILDVLARAQSLVEDQTFLETIRREAVHLSWGTTIIVITGVPSDNLAQTLLFLKKSGLQVALVLISPREVIYRQKREESMPNLKVPIFKIQHEKDIEAWTPIT
jgi:uncharacterized protein (DUF58 family)